MLTLIAFPTTIAAVGVALWGTFMRGIDWHLKVVVWLTVMLSALALLQINAVVSRIGA